MKKLYALLASALMVGTAVAAPRQIKSHDYVAGPELAQKFQAVQKEFAAPNTAMQAQLPEGMQRAVTDGTGATWSHAIYNRGKLEGLGYRNDDGSFTPIPWEDYPYYMVIMPLQKNRSAASDPQYYLPLYMIWPCAAYYNDDCWDEKTGAIDWDKAETVFGSLEAAQAAADIETVATELVYGLDASAQGFIPVLAGYYDCPCILQNDVIGAYSIWNNVDNLAMKPCVLNNQGITFAGCSYLTWKSYDPELMESAEEYNVVLGPSNGAGGVTSSSVTTVVNVSGEPTVLGFSNLILNCTEVHVFNCGLTDIDSYYGMNYDADDFTPVNRYYATWCEDSRSYIGQYSNGDPAYAWDDDFTDGKLCEVAPIVSKVAGAPYTYFNAAFYAPKDGELSGVWSMPEPSYKLNSTGQAISEWLSVPTAYELVPYYNGSKTYPVCYHDGFMGVWGNYYCSPEPLGVQVGWGDKTYGFNFKYTQDGTAYSIMGSVTTPIIMHNNPSNWNEMTQAPAIGSADANVIDSAVEAVEANSPVVSTRYYNLQGQQLTSAPAKGIFIKAELKANGTVKATKIAK